MSMTTLAIVSAPALTQSRSTVGNCIRCTTSRRPLELPINSNERNFRIRARSTISANGQVAQFPGAKEICESEEWKALESHVGEMKGAHLRELLKSEDRCRSMILSMPTRQSVEEGGFQPSIFLDYSRQLVTNKTMGLLFKLAERANLRDKIDAMFSGEHINLTEDRAVMHAALRAPRDQVIQVDGRNVVPDVWDVLDKIKSFSDDIRSGRRVGVTGKKLTNVVAIGIGGSYLGPLFVHTALRTGTHRMPRSAPELEYLSPQKSAEGRKLRFLANVDPIDVSRALSGLDPEETLAIVISKTFTTAETMLNARTVRAWITSRLGEESVEKHMVAVSTNVEKVAEFGIDPDNAFPFWDWVGGRYSVCSAVGMLPLCIQYGWDNMNRFLEGAHSVDKHSYETRFERNLPVLMGLLSIWNSSFLNYGARAILPYCQALAKFPSHIQQVAMESNGKSVDIHGDWLPFEAGEVDFGEPGTNGQHSFYQLIHQGRVVPAEFIGLVKSQQSVYLKGEAVSNHDELMSNFFAQADALAYGKTPEELEAEATSPELIPHKTFSGNRPSMSLMLPALDPYTVGQLLSLYENRIAVQGFVWGINSFDQWGVELGKTLAVKIRKQLNRSRAQGEPISSEFNFSTRFMLQHYLEGKQRLLYPEPRDFFPCELIPEADNCIASFEDSL